MKKNSFKIILIIVLVIGLSISVMAEDKFSLNTGFDFYSRYVWRGLDIASTPSIQPTISIGHCDFEFGVWGAYTISNQTSESDEIDFWLTYSRELESGTAFSAIVTDYYFPNSGIDFFNFNNYDAVIDDTIPDPGAHTIEIGLSIAGPESFPMTVSGYLNAYNDAGNNFYFQADYPLTVGNAELNLFLGMTAGSQDNPDYYGADDFSIINTGISTVKEINISDQFSLPLTFSFIVNPKAEISYLLVGASL